MNYNEFKGRSEYLLRLENGREWRSQIEEVADREDIDAAWFNGMGAVTEADLWFYDHDEQEYYSNEFREAFEVAMCVGNISFLDGERFAHTHVVLTREDCTAIGGHLDSATTYAGEIYIREFEGKVERERDHEITDLDLWSDDSLNP